MSSSRSAIFATLRRSLKASDSDVARRQAVKDRLNIVHKSIQPARGQGTQEQRKQTFIAQAHIVSATTHLLGALEDVGVAVAAYLRSHDLLLTLRCGDDPRLAGIDWAAAGLETSRGRSYGDDLTAVSYAECGVAETGTLALISGSHNPVSLNFLPDNHIVIVSTRQILATYEDAIAQLRIQKGEEAWPRTVNFITGPSRSADIEQKLLLGAHGPRRLHILIVENG